MAEKKAINKPVEEQIKFLGQECTKLVKSDGTVAVRMKKDPYFALVEKAGAGPEVLKVAVDALQNVCADAIKEAKDLCKKSKGANVQVTLGSGAFSQEIKFIGKKEGNFRNPTTGETIHSVKYGVVESTLVLPYGKVLKGEDGDLAKYSKEMDDFFNKKK